MAKWADLLISAVRYSADGNHIERVRVRQFVGGKVSRIPKESSRTEVVKNIENDKTFVTIFKSPNNWKKGQDVHIITVGKKKFIRTDKNKTARDNLENLPTF